MSNSTQAAWTCLETLKSRRELESVAGMDEERSGLNGRMQNDALHWRDTTLAFFFLFSSHDGVSVKGIWEWWLRASSGRQVVASSPLLAIQFSVFSSFGVFCLAR